LKFTSYPYGVLIYSSEATNQQYRPKMVIKYELADVEAPVVTFTTPAAGQVFKGASTVSLAWTATDNIGVTARAIYFSSNNGSAWTKIDSSVTRTTTYSWVIPKDINSSTCKLRIDAYDAAGNKGSVTSAVFSILPATGIIYSVRGINLAKEYSVTVYSLQGREISSFKTADISMLNKIIPRGAAIVKINDQRIKFVNVKN